MEKSERTKLILDMLAYTKLSKQDNSVFATCNPQYHQIAEELIARGWLLETTEKYFAPDSQDRSFELTPLGEDESGFISISVAEKAAI